MKRLCSQIVDYAEDEVLVEGDDDLSDAYNPEEDDGGEEADDDDDCNNSDYYVRDVLVRTL